MPKDILDAALGYARLGLSVVPIKADGSKAPPYAWRAFEQAAATEAQLRHWFGGRARLGIAAVCGAVSGALELLDFDDQAAGDDWTELLEGHYPDLLARLVLVATPRPGLHAWYRVDGLAVPGNQKLAWHTVEGKRKALVETRGEGGYALLPGGALEAHPTGRPYMVLEGPDFGALPVLTTTERDTLHLLARLCDRMPAPEQRPAGQKETPADSPGNDFERRASWAEVLEPHGWRLLGKRDGYEVWQRPGKENDPGHSATVGYCKGKGGEPLLRVFSSNAAPFQDGKSYGKFNAYTLLGFAGDHAAAAKELAARGYGAKRKQVKVPNKPADPDGSATETPEEPRYPFLSQVPGPDLEELDEGVTVRALMAMHLPEPSWLAQDLVPDEGLTILSGPKKSGKSWLLLDLAHAVASGGLFLGKQCKRGPVLYYVLEDGFRTTRFRLGLMGILKPDLDIRFYESMNLSADASLEAVCRRIHQYKPAAVLFDNLTQAKGATKENDNDVMGVLLGQVHRIAMHFGTAIVGAHHAGRPKLEQNSDPGFLHRGASAIAGCTVANLSLVNKGYLVGEGRTYRNEFRWSMEFDKETTYRWVRTHKDDAEGDSAFEFRPHHSRAAEEKADDRDRAERWLRARLRQSDVTPRDAREEGNKELEIDRAEEWWRQRASAIGAIAPGPGRYKVWTFRQATIPFPTSIPTTPPEEVPETVSDDTARDSEDGEF